MKRQHVRCARLAREAFKRYCLSDRDDKVVAVAKLARASRLRSRVRRVRR